MAKTRLAQRTIPRWPVVAVFIGAAVVALSTDWGGDGSKQTTAESPVILSATPRLSGAELAVRNNDGFDWTNIQMKLNSGVVKSGYVFPSGYSKLGIIRQGQTHRIPLREFAKSGGIRFNPASVKAQTLTITCDTPRGRGYWHGAW